MSKKIYKGYELMKVIADGEIKEGSKFKIHSWSEAIEYHNNNLIFIEDWVTNEEGYNYGKTIFELWNLDCILDLTLELIEDETIDIESIEELDMITEKDDNLLRNIVDNQNLILKWAKQADKEIKELKSLDIETSEKEINEALKRARNQKNGEE